MPPRAPAGLGVRGKKFWSTVTRGWELSPSELELLLEACRTMDHIEALEASLAGAIVGDAVRELRLQRTALRQLIAAMALPDDLGGAVESGWTARARHAANTRWAKADELAARRRGRREESAPAVIKSDVRRVRAVDHDLAGGAT